MRKTTFAGLTVIDPEDSLFDDNASFTGRDRDEIDRGIELGVIAHRHTGEDGLENPEQEASASVIASGGAIDPDLTITIGYTLEDSSGGETIISPLSIVTTPAPLEAPLNAPEGEVDYSEGGLLTDNYAYAITYTDGEGGETPLGPSTLLSRDPGFAAAQIKLSGLTAGMEEAEATGWRLYRAQGGGSFVFLTSGSVAEDTFTDDGETSPNAAVNPPTENVNTTNNINTLEVILPSGGVISNATYINLYASLTGEFNEAALLEQFPVASAGESPTFTDLEFLDSQPPDVNRSYGGANKIDPDTELLDFHWKRPVKTVEDLPTEGEGTEEGDVRSLTEVEVPTFYVFINGEWQLLDVGDNWKDPVNEVGELPAEGNEEGDVRAILEAETPTLYMYLGGEWVLVETGGGEGGSTGITLKGGPLPGAILWSNKSTNTIGRSEPDGSEADQEHITGVGTSPREIAVDSTYIYWCDEKAIGRMKLDGSEQEPEFISGLEKSPQGVAVNSTHIYFARANNSAAIGRANIDGTGVDGEFIATGLLVYDVVINDTHVFWINDYKVGKANLDGTGSTTIVEVHESRNLQGLGIDSEYVYWIDDKFNQNQMSRAQLDGSEPEENFIESVEDGHQIVVDEEAGYIYWADGGGTIGRAKRDGSEPDYEFITGGSETFGIALVTGAVEFAETTTLEVAGSGIVDVTLTDLGSGGVNLTIDVPEAELIDVIASGASATNASELEVIGSGGIWPSLLEPEPGEAELTLEGDRKTLGQEGMGVTVHGSDANVVRGTKFKQYTWIGSVEPVNMAEYDIWIETE